VESARVGEAEDIELLTFATECLNHFQVETGIAVITGQDLGHGKLSNGTATSLEFLHEQFEGSVLADTSKPTAEGNYYTLVGALNALRIPMKKARLGFVGVGNIGRQVLNRCIEGGAHVIGLEYSAKTRAELQESDIEVWEAERKHEFFKLPVDAFVINANAGTLDTETIIEAAENPELKFICGCENLIMPNPGDVKILRQHEKIYIPTEDAGMTGYLTAVEENLCAKANKHFDVKVMFEAAKKLEPITEDAVSYIVRNNHTLFFNEALTAVTEVS